MKQKELEDELKWIKIDIIALWFIITLLTLIFILSFVYPSLHLVCICLFTFILGYCVGRLV